MTLKKEYLGFYNKNAVLWSRCLKWFGRQVYFEVKNGLYLRESVD